MTADGDSEDEKSVAQNLFEDQPFLHSRREHLKGIVGTGAALTGLGSMGTALAEQAGNTAEMSEEVTLSEGTNIAVTASPDGNSIVMDHAGILFHLPREGGEAEQITDVELDIAHPNYAPDEERIAFQSYAGGSYDIMTVQPDGTELKQVTDHEFYDDREPEWSPDGTKIAFASDRDVVSVDGPGGHDIWTVDIETGDLQRWTDTPTENFYPTWSPDGEEIAYLTRERDQLEGEKNGGTEIKAVDRNGNTRTIISASEDETLHAPSWGPADGEDQIAYIRVSGDADSQADLMISEEQITEGEDVFVLPPDWLSADELLYTADGVVRELELNASATTEIPFTTTFELPVLDYEHKSYEFDNRGAQQVQGIQTPDLGPDGEHVAFVALSDVWVMKIGSRPRCITNDKFYNADPAWHPAGRYLAYSSDKAGTQDLYLHDTQTGDKHRLTSLEDAAISTAWSPDGSRIAFQNQNGVTSILEVDIDDGDVNTGEIREVTDPMFTPGEPTWSSDGETLAMAAFNPITDRFEGGTSQILTVDVETGETNYYPPGDEFASISPRHNDGPVWSPNGEWMAFVVNSTLRVMPVTEDGVPDGPAQQITDEVTDAPVWGGDSEWLFYLHNGQLKKARRDGSETEEIPLHLNYHRQYPTGRKVIYVGQMWDGTESEVKEDVTIEVVNNRIKSITPDSEPPNGPYVDASDLTVIPGLWDTHNHWTYWEELIGARQGITSLAYGVTTTCDRAAFVYHAVENREAFESKERIRPRYFMTGELLDGWNTDHPTNRTTTSLEQIQLEMSRASGLDYDFVKAYEQMSAERMAAIEDIAHGELGVPYGSHYMAPGFLVGQDGTTHVETGHRSGFPRDESETNQVYDDVIEFHSVGDEKRWTQTTFFNYDFILADEVEDDSRLQLFPPWRRQSLLESVEGNTEYPSDRECTTDICRSVAALKKIMDNGGLVLAGTDVPLVHNGVNLHADLRALVEYGFTNHEALLTATRFAAEHQGVEDDLGTLEAGKLADIVFVDGNPLEQIEDAIDVRMTMTNGELFTLEDLLKSFTSDGEEEVSNHSGKSG